MIGQAEFLRRRFERFRSKLSESVLLLSRSLARLAAISPHPLHSDLTPAGPVAKEHEGLAFAENERKIDSPLLHSLVPAVAQTPQPDGGSLAALPPELSTFFLA